VNGGVKLEEKERYRLFSCSRDGIHQPNIDCESVSPKPRALSALALSGIRWPHSHRPGICHQDQTWDALIRVFSLFLFDHSNTLPEVAWKAIGNRTLIVGGYASLQDT
jgi:hypothetical protein